MKWHLQMIWVVAIAAIALASSWIFTGCDMGPTFKERCEAVGGRYEDDTRVEYRWETSYNPTTKQVEMKYNPHWIYDYHCWDERGREIDV